MTFYSKETKYIWYTVDGRCRQLRNCDNTIEERAQWSSSSTTVFFETSYDAKLILSALWFLTEEQDPTCSSQSEHPTNVSGHSSGGFLYQRIWAIIGSHPCVQVRLILCHVSRYTIYFLILGWTLVTPNRLTSILTPVRIPPTSLDFIFQTDWHLWWKIVKPDFQLIKQNSVHFSGDPVFPEELT